MGDLIRIGRVSSIDYEKAYVRITYPDRDDAVSSELPYLSFEYDMPKVGEMVLAVFLSNGIEDGFVIGKYFNEENPTIESGENIYYKDFGEGSCIKFDKATKTMTIKADNIILDSSSTTTILASDLKVDTKNEQFLKGKQITLKGETETSITK